VEPGGENEPTKGSRGSEGSLHRLHYAGKRLYGGHSHHTVTLDEQTHIIEEAGNDYALGERGEKKGSQRRRGEKNGKGGDGKDEIFPLLRLLKERGVSWARKKKPRRGKKGLREGRLNRDRRKKVTNKSN